MYCHFQARLRRIQCVVLGWPVYRRLSYGSTCTLAKIRAISFHSRNSGRQGRGKTHLTRSSARILEREPNSSFSLVYYATYLSVPSFLYPFLCNRWHLIEPLIAVFSFYLLEIPFIYENSIYLSLYVDIHGKDYFITFRVYLNIEKLHRCKL